MLDCDSWGRELIYIQTLWIADGIRSRSTDSSTRCDRKQNVQEEGLFRCWGTTSLWCV